MKIEFEDQSYVECYKSDKPDTIVIAISAKDHENSLKKITNAVELSVAEFKSLISDIV